MHLNQYNPAPYTPGAPLWKQLLWYYLGSPIVRSHLLPYSPLKTWTLKQFGANLGQGIRLKPGITIKFPWRLTIGNHTWIGENTWIDNLAPITIGNHCCISQNVYLCTGNHNWSLPTFNLHLGEIHLEDSCWLAANSTVGPGVTIGQGAILTLGSVATQSLSPMTIYTGNPAQPIKTRKIKTPTP
jgi:putative colanic acid biosynthesis acetyltransferase WcaF